MHLQLFAGSRVDGAVVEAFSCLRCAFAPVSTCPSKQVLLLHPAGANVV